MSGIRTGRGSSMSSPSTPRPVGRSPIAACWLGLMPWVMNSTSRRSSPTTPSAPYRAPTSRQAADHDPLQCGAQVEVGADADHRVEQRTQPLPAGHDLADPVEQLVQQLVEAHPRQRRQAKLQHLTRLLGLVRDVSGHEADGIAAGFQR